METNELIRELLAKLAAAQKDSVLATSATTKPLSEALTELLSEANIETCTSSQYSRGLRYFEEFLGRPALASDLSHANMNSWLAWLQTEKAMQPKSVRNNRRALCRVWNFATLNWDIPTYDIRRIKQPKDHAKPVVAWTPKEIEQLLMAADTMSGTLKIGIRASRFLSAWLLVGYDTGLRPSDMRRLRWSNIRFDSRTLVIDQSKTSNVISCGLGLTAINAIKRIQQPARELVFPLGKAGVRRLELMLFKTAADFGFSRRKLQGLGTLRKSHATEVYREHGTEAAAESLGHVGGSRTARVHYIDSSATHISRLPKAVGLPSPVPLASEVQLGAALELLSAEDQLAYRLHWREGASESDIAIAFSLSTAGSKKLLARIASELQELLA